MVDKAVTRTCERCGDPAYVREDNLHPLCDSCLDWVHYGHKSYNPAGGYLTGEDRTDYALGRRSLADILLARGLIVAPTVRVIRPDTRVLPALLRECNEELIQWFTRHPEELYAVHPGTLERIVARLFEGEGFTVEMISSWNQADGGVDLIAVQKVGGLPGDIRVAIQCKRYAQTRRVSAEPIRSLNGVLDRFKAHKGVIVTTSEFTEDAWRERNEHFWRVDLRDHNSIVAALRRLRLVERVEGGSSDELPGAL